MRNYYTNSRIKDNTRDIFQISRNAYLQRTKSPRSVD